MAMEARPENIVFYLLEHCDKIKLDFNNVKHVKQV